MTPARTSSRSGSLGEYLFDRWLPAIEPTVRPATYDGYVRHLSRYLVPALGALPLQSVRPDALSMLYRDLLDHGAKGQPLSAATVRRIHTTLHRALRDAVALGYLLHNPASVAVKPKQRGVGSVEMRTCSAGELRALLDHVGGDRRYAAWRLAVSTGVRRGELLGLRWADADLAAGHIVSGRPLPPWEASCCSTSRRRAGAGATSRWTPRPWQRCGPGARPSWRSGWRGARLGRTRGCCSPARTAR